MKRLFLVLVLLAGGICDELAHPVNCLLIADSRARERRTDRQAQ